MNYTPDNFLIFICLFSICVFCGTFLIFSYNRTKLVVLSSVAFFLTALRLSTEYYLHQIDSFTWATTFAGLHSVVLFVVGVLLWITTYFYIRPFKRSQHERLLNNIFLYGIVLLPSLAQSYLLATRQIHYFNDVKIDGYWQFKAYENLATSFHFIHTYILMALIVVGLFIYDIIVERKDRLKKIFLLLAFISFPIAYSKINFTTAGDWSIPQSAPVIMFQVIVATWFVSSYRIFKDNFALAAGDVLDSISDLVIKTNKDFQIEYLNKNAIIYFGDNNDSIVDFILKNSHKTMTESREFLQEMLEYSEVDKVLTLKDKGGKLRQLEVKLSPLFEGFKTIGYTFLLTDLTKVLKQQKQLEELNATKDRLFTIIGHDLRKPALAFRGISKKINRLISKRDFETLDKFGAHIEQSAHTLNSVLDNLLQWAMPKDKLSHHTPVNINLRSNLYDSLEIYQSIAEGKGIELTMEINTNENVLADLHAFNTIIRNLMDNAIKFTAAGGTIKVIADDQLEHVLIRISDTGIGMDSRLIEEINKRQQIKSKKGTSGESGTGLGLGLVLELLQINQGYLNILSEKGMGTTMEIALPKAKVLHDAAI